MRFIMALILLMILCNDRSGTASADAKAAAE